MTTRISSPRSSGSSIAIRRSWTASPSEVPDTRRSAGDRRGGDGISTRTLHSATRIELLDSALHAPQAGFGDEDFHPSPFEKAAVLCVRLARNHPLPDGNKRLAWTATVTFLAINGIELAVDPDDAVEFMLGVAAGSIDEAQASEWIETRADPPTS